MWIEFVSALAVNQFIGAIWYSPLLFYSTFLRACHSPNRNHEKSEMSFWMLLGTIVFGALEVFGLYYALDLAGIKGGDWMEGGKLGYLLWQFIVFPMFAVHYIFDARPIMHMIMITSHHLVTLVLEGALMTYLRR